MIGIFDSGLGGLTVVKELQKALPGKGIVYFGDTARMPYGTKGPEVIRRYAAENARFLVSKGAKAIIIACNTASALGFEAARRAVKVPVFEVITPAVACAVAETRGRVGVIGTRGTVGSGAYQRALAAAARYARGADKTAMNTSVVACPLFVPLVEEGWARRAETASIAREYLAPLRSRQIDALILGCTHYPFLKPAIRAAIGPGVKIIDPARETAAAFVGYLESHPKLASKLRRAGASRYFVSDKTEHFAKLASRWLGRRITLEKATLCNRSAS